MVSLYLQCVQSCCMFSRNGRWNQNIKKWRHKSKLNWLTIVWCLFQWGSPHPPRLNLVFSLVTHKSLQLFLLQLTNFYCMTGWMDGYSLFLTLSTTTRRETASRNIWFPTKFHLISFFIYFCIILFHSLKRVVALNPKLQRHDFPSIKKKKKTLLIQITLLFCESSVGCMVGEPIVPQVNSHQK